MQDWEQIERREIISGYQARFIHSATMTFALWDIDAGAPLPEHSHPHEQVTHLLEGKFELTVDGVRAVMTAGQVMVIPSHAVHSGKALTACRILDVFSPRRDDYLNMNTPKILANNQ
jgi:quercetin dioxygenase-like cupin family protein